MNAEVIAFGFYDLELETAHQEPRLQEQQRARFERMAPVRRVDGR